ncbi:MAG: winged helix-turn-helix transcriptional regulator [Tenericutes bacterium]|nr:winged helix-turn-helix transcriptional regulator [Mycoplasmatota bacterium]
MNLTKMFKVFSDETRVEVFKYLSKGRCCTCEFENKIGVSQPTLAYHMKMIKDSGLATTEKVGTWNKYHIDNLAIDKMIAFLEGMKLQNLEECNCK